MGGSLGGLDAESGVAARAALALEVVLHLLLGGEGEERFAARHAAIDELLAHAVVAEDDEAELLVRGAERPRRRGKGAGGGVGQSVARRGTASARVRRDERDPRNARWEKAVGTRGRASARTHRHERVEVSVV